MKKRLNKLSLFLIVGFASILSLASCDNNENEGGGGKNPPITDVGDKEVTGIETSVESLSLSLNETKSFTYEVLPSDAKNKEIDVIYDDNYINLTKTNNEISVTGLKIGSTNISLISNNNITKALNNISFTVNDNEFLAIMGASGSGKTTLLNTISTIDTVTSGNIIINGIDITNLNEEELSNFRKENLGFVFQDFNLLDTLTIKENIALSLIINKEDKTKIDDLVLDISKKLGISDILSKYPYEVSGGQKQRCACARALINSPKLILADEPTGALDSRNARVLLETFKEMNEELKATILMVTHDAFSASFASRVLFIKDGKIFNEIIKGKKTRGEFYDEIIDVLTLLGGDVK